MTLHLFLGIHKYYFWSEKISEEKIRFLFTLHQSLCQSIYLHTHISNHYLWCDHHQPPRLYHCHVLTIPSTHNTSPIYSLFQDSYYCIKQPILTKGLFSMAIPVLILILHLQLVNLPDICNFQFIFLLPLCSCFFLPYNFSIILFYALLSVSVMTIYHQKIKYI